MITLMNWVASGKTKAALRRLAVTTLLLFFLGYYLGGQAGMGPAIGLTALTLGLVA